MSVLGCCRQDRQCVTTSEVDNYCAARPHTTIVLLVHTPKVLTRVKS